MSGLISSSGLSASNGDSGSPFLGLTSLYVCEEVHSSHSSSVSFSPKPDPSPSEDPSLDRPFFYPCIKEICKSEKVEETEDKNARKISLVISNPRPIDHRIKKYNYTKPSFSTCLTLFFFLISNYIKSKICMFNSFDLLELYPWRARVLFADHLPFSSRYQ